MTLSRSRKPFHVAKDLHPLTLEALIGTCSKSRSFVIDFATSTSIYILNLPFLHWIFELKCLLTFYFLQVIVCWHVKILANTYWYLMEIKRSLIRFFTLFFKTKDPEAKNRKNIPQFLSIYP
jgi:hypothetical protein